MRVLTAALMMLALWLVLSTASAAPRGSSALADGDCALGGASWLGYAGSPEVVTPVTADGHPACTTVVTDAATSSDGLWGESAFTPGLQLGDVVTVAYYIKVAGGTERSIFLDVAGQCSPYPVAEFPVDETAHPQAFDGNVTCTMTYIEPSGSAVIVGVQNVGGVVEVGETLTWALNVCLNAKSCGLPYCTLPHTTCKGKPK